MCESSFFQLYVIALVLKQVFVQVSERHAAVLIALFEVRLANLRLRGPGRFSCCYVDLPVTAQYNLLNLYITG